MVAHSFTTTLSTGLVNPKCVGLVGNGVVVHLPSFFKELDELQSQGLDCSNRLFISDRAQLVFDFHQIVDGLKEVELGRSRYALFFSIGELICIALSVALGPRSEALVPHTLEKLPGLVFGFITSSIRKPLRQNSAYWLKEDTKDTGISNTIPKGRYFDTRLVSHTLRCPPGLTRSFPDLGIGGEVEAVRRRQCRLYPHGFEHRKAGPRRRGQCVDAGY